MPEIKELEEEQIESHRPPFLTEKVLKHISDKKPEIESPRHRKERINAYKEYQEFSDRNFEKPSEEFMKEVNDLILEKLSFIEFNKRYLEIGKKYKIMKKMK